MLRPPTKTTRLDTPFLCPPLFRSLGRLDLGLPDRTFRARRADPVLARRDPQPRRSLCRDRSRHARTGARHTIWHRGGDRMAQGPAGVRACDRCRSEEHTSELQSLMRNPYAVFFLQNKNNPPAHTKYVTTI